MPDQSHPGSRTGRLRTAGLLTLAAALFLAVGWSVFWYVAHRSAMGELDRWLAAEAADGRTWACAQLRSGGYPIAIEIDCDQPTLKVADGPETSTAALAHALVRAPLYTPKLVTVDLTGPLTIAAGAISSSASWRNLQVSTRGLPDRLDRLSIVGDGARIETKIGGMAIAPVSIVAFQAHVRRASGAIAAPFNLALSIAGVESPVLDAATGSAIPAVFAAIGSVTQVDKAPLGTLPERIELWRAAGGRVTVNLLSLQKGALAIQGEGGLGLDQARRLDGKLDIRMQNANEPLMALATRLGLFQQGSLVGALASTLLAQNAGGETRFALSFENGSLGVGPLKGILPLPPLY